MARRRGYRGYRSKLEYEFASTLKELNIKFEYEQHEFVYLLKETRCECHSCGEDKEIYSTHWYLVDFYLPDYDLYIETKGKFTSSDRTKMKAVMEYHPDMNVAMVFQRNNWITKKHVSRYSDWCESNNMQYLIL